MRAALVTLLAGCWTSSAPAPQEPPPRKPPPDAAEVVIQPEVLDHLDMTGASPVTAPSGCPSGQGLTATIANATAQGGATIVEIDVGTGQGITRRWDIGGPAPCSIIRIEQARTIAACRLPPAQIMAAPTAVLCAPAAPSSPQAPGCPSGIGFEARVVGVSITGSDTVITVAGGDSRGVDLTWQVVRPPCAVVKVTSTAAIAKCANLTPAQLKTSPNALLCKP